MKTYKCDVCGSYSDWGIIWRWGKDYCVDCYHDLLKTLLDDAQITS